MAVVESSLFAGNNGSHEPASDCNAQRNDGQIIFSSSIHSYSRRNKDKPYQFVLKDNGIDREVTKSTSQWHLLYLRRNPIGEIHSPIRIEIF